MPKYQAGFKSTNDYYLEAFLLCGWFGGTFLSTSVQKSAILVDRISTLQSRYCWYLKGHLQPQHITQNTQQPRTKMSRVGILPDGHIHMNPLPQIPTKHSVPTSRECLPSYFGIPTVILQCLI